METLHLLAARIVNMAFKISDLDRAVGNTLYFRRTRGTLAPSMRRPWNCISLERRFPSIFARSNAHATYGKW